MSTWKIKEYHLSKDKAKMVRCIKTYTIAYVKIQKKRKYTVHYVKPTTQLMFKSRFSKGGPTCRMQVVNPRHQSSQGQSVAKPETTLQNTQVELLDVTKRGPMTSCWIRYSERRSRGKNILGGERLQNAKYLVSKCYLKQIPKATGIVILDTIDKPKKMKSGIQPRNRALPRNTVL